MEKEKINAQKRKLNMKLYPMYRMLSADILFYNAVKILFLTQIKQISNANVVLLESFYSFFKMILQIPMTVVISKIGKRKSIILGNIFLLLELIIIIFSKGYIYLIISQIISSIAWACKSVSEGPLLNQSIPEAKTKSRIFTKIDSKGYSKYCYISAITTIMAGFLYEINPYIPIIFATTIVVLTLIMSLNFNDMEEEKEENKTIKQSIIEVKEDFKYILKSRRLRNLLLIIGVMWGIICLFGTYQNTLLKDINVPAKYIGIILAMLEILQGVASTKANKFNDKYKNKSLTYIALKMTIGIAIAGAVVIIGIPRIPQLAIIIFTYILRMYDKGIFQILKRRYIGNFTTPEVLTKIYSASSVICSIFRMSVSAIGSYLLTIMTIEYAMVFVGIIFTMVITLLSIYIKSSVGLQPEQYKKRDLLNWQNQKGMEYNENKI